ncbi:glycosyltransferase family 4 protein [Citrobacter freundii]|nr:glycosyltransferase family 4 protein [Citrobacter freundii]MBC6509510.1 glycosyltransferase family 4 protein [Citrobacter freundii]
MNILFTESSSNIGGQELQALLQMETLKKLGHSVLLACREKSRILIEAEKRKIDTEFIPFRNSIHLLSVLKLFFVIKSFRPDVVICHSGHDSNIAGLTRLITGRKSFHIIRQKTYLTKNTGKFSLNNLCDHIIVPGTAMKYYLESAGVNTPVTVIPPGFDFRKMRDESNTPLPAHIQKWLDVDHKKPLIIQVGMLRAEKGHEFMLKLLFQLKNEGIHFRWLIVGEGRGDNEMVLLDMARSMGMKNDILLTGFISPVSPVYKNASLLVMPSVNEPFGMAVVEACVFSVPVIANNTGGISDIIKNDQTGRLLPIHSSEEWIKALNDFFKRPIHYQNMADLAKNDVEKRFNINQTVFDIIKLCEKK